MRSLVALLTILMVAVFMISLQAQESGHAAHHHGQVQMVQSDSGTTGGMMKGGMMQHGMMQGGMMGGKGMMSMMEGKGMMEEMGPLHQYMHLIHHLPKMKEKLELSDQQVEQLKNLQADFLKRKADWKADIEKRQIDFKLVLDKEPAASEVRKNLKGIMDVTLKMIVAGYETALKMKSILTDEQKTKLKDTCPMCMGGGGMMEMMGSEK